jgi:hypothetical protein
MTTLKTLTIVAALLAGGVSLAMAQGPGTGAYPPVAGGANGNPILDRYNGFSPGYGGWYGGAPRYGYRPYRHLYAYSPYRRYRYRHY